MRRPGYGPGDTTCHRFWSWVASQTHTAADYNSKIDQLRVNFAAQLDGELRDRGSQHYTMDCGRTRTGTRTIFRLTRQNIAVQKRHFGRRFFRAPGRQSTQSTTDTTYQIATPTFCQQ